MRSTRAFVFAFVVYLALPAANSILAEPPDYCIAVWGGCNTNSSCTPAISIPSCNSLCQSQCSANAVGSGSMGCGNSGAGGCAYPNAFLSKTCSCDTVPTPILINLASNSPDYDLTSAVDGVAFDINADGVLDQVAWTETDSPVAFLVLDRDHDGTIDDGSELFGNATIMSTGSRAANGFDALLDLDGGTSISDGKIDVTDAVYPQLRLWLDRNHNGFSETNELVTLVQGRLNVIFTDYRESRHVDRNGNHYRFFGTALMSTNGKELPRRIFDVFLSTVR